MIESLKSYFRKFPLARDFFANYLPEDVLAYLDLDGMKIVEGSFVDEELREYHSDLLFDVSPKSGRPTYIYLLFEHKSFVDYDVGFQLLQYMVRVWTSGLLSRKEGKLPIIIPLVLYHGRQYWTVGTDFSFLFDCPDSLKRFIPDFQFLLWDAYDYDDDQICGEIQLKVCLLVLKHIFDEDLGERLPNILKLAEDLVRKKTGLEYIETILRYILNAVPKDRIEKKRFSETLKIAFDDSGD
ncbi:MAG: Rpn family recombination-promoting nuclease/putative transposase, partial [bacterium]|nr:Rpn family recombination-promoting nuclease/putative transposase [bacterium]